MFNPLRKKILFRDDDNIQKLKKIIQICLCQYSFS